MDGVGRQAAHAQVLLFQLPTDATTKENQRRRVRSCSFSSEQPSRPEVCIGEEEGDQAGAPASTVGVSGVCAKWLPSLPGRLSPSLCLLVVAEVAADFGSTLWHTRDGGREIGTPSMFSNGRCCTVKFRLCT